MRGKAIDLAHTGERPRITPAHAGKSDICVMAGTEEKDHPRACGEKNIVRKASFDPQGSPPRMRGKGYL